MFSDVIYLGEVAETKSIYGDVIRTTTWTKKYADKKAVRLSEFYNAENVGLKPEAVFRIRAVDYVGQERLKYNNIEYQIIRTYEKREFVELVVSTSMGELNG